MSPEQIAHLRRDLGLSQIQFGELFGAHFMTISRWERGLLHPSAYQLALLEQFRRTADAKKAEAQDELKKVLVGAGIVAALVWLLNGR